MLDRYGAVFLTYRCLYDGGLCDDRLPNDRTLNRFAMVGLLAASWF